MCLFIKNVFSLCSSLHSTRTELHFISPMWGTSLRKTCSQWPCTRTHLTRVEMGRVLLFFRDWNFGSPDYLPCGTHPNGWKEAGKLAPYPKMGGGQVQGSHQSRKRWPWSWGCPCEDLIFLVSAWLKGKSWKSSTIRLQHRSLHCWAWRQQGRGTEAVFTVGDTNTTQPSTEASFTAAKKKLPLHLEVDLPAASGISLSTGNKQQAKLIRKVGKQYVKRHNAAFSAWDNTNIMLWPN